MISEGLYYTEDWSNNCWQLEILPSQEYIIVDLYYIKYIKKSLLGNTLG